MRKLLVYLGAGAVVAGVNAYMLGNGKVGLTDPRQLWDPSKYNPNASGLDPLTFGVAMLFWPATLFVDVSQYTASASSQAA